MVFVLMRLGRLMGFFRGVMRAMRFFHMFFAGMAVVFGCVGMGFARLDLAMAGFGGVVLGARRGLGLGRLERARLVQRLCRRRGLEVAGQRLIFRLGVAQGAGHGQADGDERAYQLDQVHFVIRFVREKPLIGIRAVFAYISMSAGGGQRPRPTVSA